MEFYIAQAIGLVIAGLSLIIQHFKKMPTIVAMEVLMNFMAGVQYLLLDGLSGACISMVGSVNALCMLIYVKVGDPEKRFVPNLLCILLGVIHVAIGLWSFRAWYDVFPILGAIFATLSVVQAKPMYYRIFRIGNGISWIVYCLFSSAYTMILMQALGIFSGVTAILRLDIKKKEKNTIE